MNRRASLANQSSSDKQSRRSSLIATSDNIDLIFSPSKPPITDKRLELAKKKAEDIAVKMSQKSVDFALSELVLLQKSGSPNGVANIRNSEINFLINHVICLVKEVRSQSSEAEVRPPSVEVQPPGKIEIQLCDVRFEIKELKEKVKTLQMQISHLERTLEKEKSTLELAFDKKAEDLELNHQMNQLENLIRIGQLESQYADVISASQQPMQSTQVPTQEVVDESNDEIFKLDLDEVLDGLETESQMNSELNAINDVEDDADFTLDSWADGHSREIALDMVGLIIEMTVKDIPKPMKRVTKHVKHVRFETADTASQTEAAAAANGPDDRVAPAPASNQERASVDVFELMKPGEYPEEELAMKRDNHFSIILTGCKIPASVKKMATVRKLERKFATEMTQSLYPQFHESCIKYIKCLRPRHQPRTEPYDIKVVYGSEHVRQHVLSAACHAQLLVRPFISGQQLEVLREEQEQRYSIQGTSTPGPAFLACGGAASLRRMHPSTEASMKAYNKEYQRRKRFKRELVVGGRHRPNMTTLVVDTPVYLNNQTWNNQLQKAYNKFVMTRDVRDFFNGARLQPPSSYPNMGAAATARTATSGSAGPTTPSSTPTPIWEGQPRQPQK